MKKQLLVIIIFTVAIFGISSQEKNLLGTWETVIYDGVLEMVFEKDAVIARVYKGSYDEGDSEIENSEKAFYGMLGDSIILDNVIYNYLIIDDKLLLSGRSDVLLLKRKQESLFTKDMLIGKWSVQKDDQAVELLFDENGTVTSTVYEEGEMPETNTEPYELGDRYLKMGDTYFLFKATFDNLFLLENKLLLKKEYSAGK